MPFVVVTEKVRYSLSPTLACSNVFPECNSLSQSPFHWDRRGKVNNFNINNAIGLNAVKLIGILTEFLQIADKRTITADFLGICPVLYQQLLPNNPGRNGLAESIENILAESLVVD